MKKSKMKKVYSLTLIVLMMISCKTENQSATTVAAESVVFSTEIAADATPTVLKRILEAKERPISEIKFEKGIYHFHSEKGKEFFVFISNHNDERIKTAFPLANMHNLTIDGQGSTFIFHGRMIPFFINDCKNIKIKNLSVDWERSFHSEALVVARDEKNKTFDLSISDEYPYEIRNEQIYFIKEDYEHTIGQAILYNPERKAIAYDTESYTPLTSFSRTAIQNKVNTLKYKYGADPIAPEQLKLGRENKLKIKQLKPGLVRVYNHTLKIPKVGLIMVCKGDQWANRLAPAFRVTHTYGFEATNVNVHHAGGMGLIAENSANLTLDSFNVTPSRGRMVSTTADATHFVGCRGKVIIKNCTFNNQLDDASNVHGTYQKVVDILDENSIGVRMGHFQQQGFQIGIPNDTIGLVRLSKSFFDYDKLTLKSVEKINGRYHIVTFNEKVPAALQPGDLIENLDGYPELLVENCNISRNRARGLLLSTPKKTVIKNNYFGTEMEALLIPVESGYWYESGSITDLTITGNTFDNCNHSGYDRGIIRFETDDDNENIAFKNVVISNNKITHYDNLFLEINNTDGLKFTGNEIKGSTVFPALFPKNPAIHVKASKNIEFSNNMYSGKAKNILETDSSVPGLVFK